MKTFNSVKEKIPNHDALLSNPSQRKLESLVLIGILIQLRLWLSFGFQTVLSLVTCIVRGTIINTCVHSGLVIAGVNCRNREELWSSFQIHDFLLISTSFPVRYYFVRLKLADFISKWMQEIDLVKPSSKAYFEDVYMEFDSEDGSHHIDNHIILIGYNKKMLTPGAGDVVWVTM